MKKLNKIDSSYVLGWSKKIRAIKLLGGKCNRCGCSDLIALDFHHLRDKYKDFNKLKSLRWSIIRKEIAKCELLCANCHGEEHYKNGRNGKEVTVFMLNRSLMKCSKCGYKGENVGSLDFHHINKNDKNFTMNSVLLRKVKVSIEEIEKELLKCVVLCRNCHRKEHFQSLKFNKFRQHILEKVETHKELRPKINRNSILEMYNNGMRQIDIVNQLGCSKGTISDIIKDLKQHNFIPR